MITGNWTIWVYSIIDWSNFKALMHDWNFSHSLQVVDGQTKQFHIGWIDQTFSYLCEMCTSTCYTCCGIDQPINFHESSPKTIQRCGERELYEFLDLEELMHVDLVLLFMILNDSINNACVHHRLYVKLLGSFVGESVKVVIASLNWIFT